MRGLAFIDKQKEVSKLIEIVKRYEVKELIIATDVDLYIENNENIRVKKIYIEKYIPKNINRESYRMIEEIVQKITDNNPRLKEKMMFRGVSLLPLISYPFGGVSQHWFRRIIIMKQIIEEKKPEVVFVSNDYKDYIELGNLGKNIKVKKTADNIERNIKWRLAYILFWSVGGLLYKTILPVIIGKLLNITLKMDISKSKIIMIGSVYHNSSFRSKWDVIIKRERSAKELVLLDGSWPIRWIAKRKDNTAVAEGIASIKDITLIAECVIEIISEYKKANIPQIFNKDKKEYGRLLREVDRMFLLNMPRSILFIAIGNKLIKKTEIDRIILSMPNVWSSVSLSKYLEGSRIETVSITHGLALDPIAYRSNNSRKVVWGAMDIEVLKEYSQDKEYISIGNKPSGTERKQGTEKNELSSKFVALNTAGKKEMEKIEEDKNIVAILPSSNLKKKYIRKYFITSLTYLNENRERYDYKNIVIKLHPKSTIEYINQSVGDILESFEDLKIYGSKTVAIEHLFEKCSFALCTPSSIMLDLLEYTVPFSVYMEGYKHNMKLVSTYPSWMRWREKTDLEEISEEKIEKYYSEAELLKENYWVANVKDKNVKDIVDILLDYKN
ncbi:MAG: hypothetical protein GY861_05185 [bacterium]|nr:hypothetical protein [bacterium]